MTLVFAHRGASHAYPENTLAAFAGAVAMGSDGVELDVRRTADHQLIIHHDPHLGDGRIIADTLAGDLPDSVASFDDALDACAGLIVNIEIKNDPREPDFDPNDRPRPPTEGAPDDSPLFNRAAQGVYELGSTFKIFTAAQAMELGLVNANTMINTKGPLRWGKHKIRDFHNYGKELSVHKVIVKSSNIGTARMAQMIGSKRQREFLDSMGLLERTPLEILESRGSTPLLPKNWSEISTMTISYGHGISVSPLHLAAGYAAIANGGTRINPTLIKQDGPQYGPRVMRAEVAAASRAMLRAVVTEGTASFGEVKGYAVGGKTGTADKPKPRGGYYKDKVIATFASMFPAYDPKYVLIVTLDEPETFIAGETRRTAGWTAVPVAAEMIHRVAPLLGLRPQVEPGQLAGITLTSN